LYSTRALVLYFSVLCGIVSSQTLDKTAFMKHARLAGYRLAQEEFGKISTGSKDIRILDLSSLIFHRGTKILEPGSASELELEAQFLMLEDVLQSIRTGNPKAVVIDWSLVLPDEFRSDSGNVFSFHSAVLEETREAY